MISIVIPNFNGGKLLEKNLPKLFDLLKKSKLKHEVIVVDDASTDGSVELLSILSRGGLVKVITKTKNTGFATTVDEGIRAAKGEIVFTLKTDALPESAEYFQLILGHFGLKKNLSFAVSAALKTIENGKEEIRGSGEIYFEKGFFLHRRGKPELRSAWPDGGASAFRRDLYLKLGGFDPLYNPFYWEDVDLGYRAWKAGYRIDFEPRARLRHDFESGAIAKHYTKEQVEIISQRNQFIFVWKNGDWKHLLSYCFWEPYHVAIAFKNRNWQFFEAYWQAVSQFPRILVARWRQKSISQLSDDTVLQKLIEAL